MSEEEIRKYIDNKISHTIKAVEYGNFFYEQIKILVDKAKDDCKNIFVEYKRCGTKGRCQALIKEIDARLKEMKNEIDSLIETELPKIIQEENNWLKNNVEKPLGISLAKDDKMLVKLTLIPIATAGAAGLFGELISDRLKNIYQSQTLQGYVTGVPFSELEDEYNSRLNSFDRGLEADAETMGGSLGEQYERIVFTKNKDKIKKYMWSSILDTTTCIACGYLDGRVYTDITEVPVYPLHDRCRCTLIPLPEDSDGEDFRETYSKWFERQSEEDKYKILGKKRFQLYEQGMKIKQFVNNGKITPLKDLKNQKG